MNDYKYKNQNKPTQSNQINQNPAKPGDIVVGDNDIITRPISHNGNVSDASIKIGAELAAQCKLGYEYKGYIDISINQLILIFSKLIKK